MLHHAVEVEVSVKLLVVLTNAPVSNEDTAVITVPKEKNMEDVAKNKSLALKPVDQRRNQDFVYS